MRRVRLASSRDDVVYISDDAASDINDASDEPFDETLPSIQVIVRSLEDAGKMDTTAEDGLEQMSQRKDAHEVSGRSADSTPLEHGQLNESHRPTVDIAAECPVGVSVSAPRMCTSRPTLMTDRSRTGSPSCESSLRVGDPTHARHSSASADDEGMEKPSLSEIPQRVDSQLRPHSSVSQPQQPSPPGEDCTRVAMTVRESPSPSQRASTKEDSFDVFYTAPGHTDTSCDQASDETLPPVRTAVPTLEETGEIGSSVGNGEQTSNSGDEREPSHGRHSSTLLDRGQINHSAGFSFAEPADCLTEAPSSISRIRCPTASTRASSRLNSLSPESQVWDTVSTQTSYTSMSAPGNDEDEIDDQICTGTEPPEKAADDSGEREYTCDEEPLMSQMSLRARNKRSREPLANHGTDQFEVGGLHGALDDPEYCPAPGDESEADSDSLSSDEEQASRKRRKFGAEPSKNKSRDQPSAHPALAGLDQASEPISAAQEDAVAEPTDAAFDEWILQDVVLKRTIMDGKATFVFQFDWDLCAKHGQAPREPCKRPKQQSKAKPVVKNNGRRRFTTLEDRWLVTWKEEQGLCWAEIHSHFCAKFEERSKEALQVWYCTRLKQCDDD